jgi:hypothetical protein
LERYKGLRGWNGTVSFWLSLNPDQDLTGFSDPIQITDKDYNDAAMWVDFTGNDKPRHFRLGVFGNLLAWNPNSVRGQTNPEFLRHIVAVTTPPFARGTWTHVAFTFSGLNSQPPGSAKLYVNGKMQGSTEPITEPFTWDITKAKIRVGVNYVGLLDELSIFSRALRSRRCMASQAECPACVAEDGFRPLSLRRVLPVGLSVSRSGGA